MSSTAVDAAIAQALQARAGSALDVELRLFRLFLARGVANLTAAVARPNDARTDLALAAYLRPGAVFPKAWDVEETYGWVEGNASTYLTAGSQGRATPALRAGGSAACGLGGEAGRSR